MFSTPIIRQFLAGVLLLLFAFSITPKKTLHDFFAHHRDTPVQCVGTGDDGTAKISMAGFNCHCENLVVVSPFTATILPAKMAAPDPETTHYCRMGIAFYQMPSLYFGLRGPPVS